VPVEAKEYVMALKQDFAAQVKAQTDIWRAQIKDYEERVEQAGAKAQGDYKNAVAEMETKAEDARKLFERVQAAKEAAWQDMQSGTQKAFVELQRGWADALSRFR
jgi:hypothetical protein